MKVLQLILTNTRDFKCQSCVTKDVEFQKYMKLNTAKNAVDEQIKVLDHDETLLVVFIIADFIQSFPLMKNIYDYVESLRNQVKRQIQYSITTRDQHINEDIMNFLKKSDINMMLIVNENDNIPLKKFFKDMIKAFNRQYSKERVIFKYIVYKWNISNLSSDIRLMVSHGASGLTFELDTFDDWNINDLQMIDNQIDEICNFYGKRIHEIDIVILDNVITQILYPADDLYCGAGEDITVVGVEGNKYICPLLIENDLITGNVNELEFESGWKYIYESEKSECIDCPLTRICKRCIAINYKHKNSFYKEVPIYCNYKKILIRHSLRFIEELLLNDREVFLKKYKYI